MKNSNKFTYSVILLLSLYSIQLNAQDHLFDSLYRLHREYQYEKALQLINSALITDNHSQEDINDLYYNKGFSHEMLGELDSAIWSYEKVILNDSMNIPAINALAMLYGDFELYEEAYHLFKQLTEIDTSLLIPYSNIVYYKGLEGNYKEAISIAKQYIPLAKDTVTKALLLNNLSFALYKTSNLDEAMSAVKQSLEILDQNAYAHRNLGLILFAQKREKEACESFQTSLELGGTENIQLIIEELCKEIDK